MDGHRYSCSNEIIVSSIRFLFLSFLLQLIILNPAKEVLIILLYCLCEDVNIIGCHAKSLSKGACLRKLN